MKDAMIGRLVHCHDYIEIFAMVVAVKVDDFDGKTYYHVLFPEYDELGYWTLSDLKDVLI